jgi:hypothetical protein
MPFPPIPSFPKAIDTDRTLFLVYNSTESKLCSDNAAFAEEVEIIPVPEEADEIWPSNGFATIEGEMFYYDSVGLDSNGKVNKLKGCARSLTGKTKFNPRGTWVRGFVVAEHHNQLVDAVLNLENFVGYNFDTRHETLDWRIRNLQSLNVITDDFGCPDVIFHFNVLDDDPEAGIIASYSITITPPGSITSFRLDFGDGTFTTTLFEGTHQYALNSVVDPVLTISNDRCQMVLTPVERENPSEPPVIAEDEFAPPFPDIPDFPDFTFVPCTVPEADINLPPIVFPCVSLSGSNFPSIIDGPDINMVSHVVIEGPDINIPSHVTIEGGFSLPSIIYVDAPPTIVIDPPIPPTIVIVTQSSITLGVNWSDMPAIPIDWGEAPPMEVKLSFAQSVPEPTLFAQDTSLKNEFGDEFADLFAGAERRRIDFQTVGIPSEIKIESPVFPKVEVDASALKDVRINIETPNIPTDIIVHGPETPIPTDITIHGPVTPLPTMIEVVNKNVPTQIEVVCPDLPRKIELELTSEIPKRILVEIPTPIPTTIFVDGSGIPTTLTVEGFPKGIPVLFPDEMPKIELVYKGSPIEMKISMDEIMTTADGEKRPCFALVPCQQ